jgi:hypothetical protein
MRKNGIEKPCEVCGKMMYVQPNQLKRGEGRYCSRACKGRRMAETLRPWARPEEKLTTSNGYVLVWAPGHPRASKKRVFEHILVAEQKIGRPLVKGEEVHHVDLDKQNNDPSNLMVVSASEHQKYHPNIKHWVTITCQECGKSFEAKPSRAYATDPVNQRKYCSLACRYKAWGRKMHPGKEGT